MPECTILLDHDGWFWPMALMKGNGWSFTVMTVRDHGRSDIGRYHRYKNRDDAQAVINRWIEKGWTQVDDMKSSV